MPGQMTKDDKKEARSTVDTSLQVADKRHAGAQLYLGVIYQYEIGFLVLRKNSNEAARWYQKAADQGYAEEAQSYLKRLHHGEREYRNA